MVEIKAKGRITNLWKQQLRDDCLIQGVKHENQFKILRDPMIRGSNGTYVKIGEYHGTALYFNITVYEPPCFEFNGKRYQVPERFRINCYEATREVLNHKSFGNLAIYNTEIEEFQNSLIGKKTIIQFFAQEDGIDDDRLKVTAFLPFKVKGKNTFYGNIAAKEIIR